MLQRVVYCCREAKRADIVRGDFSIGDHARILPTPGHTPGHVAFTFGRTRDEAVFSGDVMHSPLQARYPELSGRELAHEPGLGAWHRRPIRLGGRTPDEVYAMQENEEKLAGVIKPGINLSLLPPNCPGNRDHLW